MASLETIATNHPEEAEREAPVLERAEPPISPEEQMKQAMEAAEAAMKEFDPAEADAEMVRDQSGYAERLGASSESIAKADEAIVGELAAIKKEESGLLEKLNAKLKKYVGVAGLAAATAGPAAAMENPTDGFQPEADDPKIVEVLLGDAPPKPDIPPVFRMETNLPKVSDDEAVNGTENGIRLEKSELSDPMKEFSRLLGVYGSEHGDIDAGAPVDPIVLRLTRELEDPEGVFKEGEVVMEGYQGFTEKQLKSLQKLSELADREFSFVFSRDGNGRFETRSRGKGERISSTIDTDRIYEGLQENREIVQAHTHPARHTTVYIPSVVDLMSDVQIRRVAEQRGYDSDNFRDVAVAPNGVWEYSMDPYKPAARHLIEFSKFTESLSEAGVAEIRKMGLSPEKEQELLGRLETMNGIDIMLAANNSEDESIRRVARAIKEKMNVGAEKYIQSPVGEFLKGYGESILSLGSNETPEKREEFIRWVEQNGIRMRFTPFPENVAGGE
jgi:hypothetical protein